MTMTARTFLLAAALLLAVHVTTLHLLGQPWIAADGVVRLWESDPFSVRMSQELADWYSFSHLIHGFIFYGLLKWCAPRLPLPARLLIAMGVEVSWEIAENSPFVIDAYRKQALAAGYNGDSILNSVSDVVMMCTGFFIASRLRARYVIALALAFEIMTAVTIRDGLFFNVLNFAWPIQAVHDWQAGAKR
ncbi:MAG: hypothetical protein JWN16_2238 [Alphaproteobacteria bacterium]|nr:hypothetical protein [Alphaproteobacteria bacterium]